MEFTLIKRTALTLGIFTALTMATVAPAFAATDTSGNLNVSVAEAGAVTVAWADADNDFKTGTKAPYATINNGSTATYGSNQYAIKLIGSLLVTDGTCDVLADCTGWDLKMSASVTNPDNGSLGAADFSVTNTNTTVDDTTYDADPASNLTKSSQTGLATAKSILSSPADHGQGAYIVSVQADAMTAKYAIPGQYTVTLTLDLSAGAPA